MAKELLKKALHTLLGRRYRVVLERQRDHISLKSFKGKHPVPFPQVVKQYGILSNISRFLLSASSNVYIVSLEGLATVKACLANVLDESLAIDIAPEVATLQPIAPPADFKIMYVWSYDNNRIEKRTRQNAIYFGNGWFVNQHSYWQIQGLNDQNDEWLRKDVIEEQAIIPFFTQILPRWQKAHLPCYSPLQYCEDPILNLTIIAVENNRVSLNIAWREPSEYIKILLPTINHVIAAGQIRPGLLPQQLPQKSFRTSGMVHLHNEEIALFQQEIWPLLHKWINGKVDEFHAQHNIIKTGGALKLVVQHQVQQGIGMTIAVPTFVCGSIRLPAQKASDLLASSRQYLRVPRGWLPIQSLIQAGITAASSHQDQPYSPIILKPNEIITQGLAGLQGVWSDIEFPPIKLPESSSPHQTASLHLQFLRTWGIPGGIIGTITQYQAAFATLFTDLITDYPQAKILVLGSKNALDEVALAWADGITARFDGNKSEPSFDPFSQGIFLVTPKALNIHANMIKTEWNLLCLLEADEQIKSNRSKLFQQLINYHKLLVLGLFGSDIFLKNTQANEAMSNLFGLSPYMNEEFIWRYALRDPVQKAPPLPTSYRQASTPRPASASVQLAEFTIGKLSDSGGLSIPPRLTKPQVSPSPRNLRDTSFRLGAHYDSRESMFVKQAKKLVKRTEKSAQFVSFREYWPIYEAMTLQQQKWYFYWRTQVRQSDYPDTSLSYIFVYVYELINNIGIQNKMDGYEKIRRLWLHYRERHPKLDNYLLDWLVDYALVNQCPFDPLSIYTESTTIGENLSYQDYDLILAHYIRQPLSQMPFVLIEKLSDHQIQRSKFYTDGHQQLIKQYLPQILEQANRYLEQHSGKGIFEWFKPDCSTTIRRQPFRSAIYVGSKSEIIIATILPYTQHQPLRDYLTALVKHTENKLRELKNYNGRLRGYLLDPATEAVIDQFIMGVAYRIAPLPKPRVEIDLAEVERLRQESSQVFHLLQIAPEETSASGFKSQQATLPSPSGIKIESDELDRLTKETDRLFALLQVDETKTEKTDNGKHDPDIIGSSEHEHQHAVSFVPGSGSGSALDIPFAQLNHELPPEWAAFASQLANYQLRILEALITKSDPTATISQIAEVRITMPEPLLDEINELAQGTVGDIIIETIPLPHVSDTEYLAFIQKIVTTEQ